MGGRQRLVSALDALTCRLDRATTLSEEGAAHSILLARAERSANTTARPRPETTTALLLPRPSTRSAAACLCPTRLLLFQPDPRRPLPGEPALSSSLSSSTIGAARLTSSRASGWGAEGGQALLQPSARLKNRGADPLALSHSRSSSRPPPSHQPRLRRAQPGTAPPWVPSSRLRSAVSSRTSARSAPSVRPQLSLPLVLSLSCARPLTLTHAPRRGMARPAVHR